MGAPGARSGLTHASCWFCTTCGARFGLVPVRRRSWEKNRGHLIASVRQDFGQPQSMRGHPVANHSDRLHGRERNRCDGISALPLFCFWSGTNNRGRGLHRAPVDFHHHLGPRLSGSNLTCSDKNVLCTQYPIVGVYEMSSDSRPLTVSLSRDCRISICSGCHMYRSSFVQYACACIEKMH